MAFAAAATLTALVLVHCARTVSDMLELPGAVVDDALVYPQVARRVARGEGATFSGVMPTNGFQPLWLALLVPLARVFTGSSLLRAGVVLGGVFLFLAMRGAARVVRGEGGGPGSAWTAIGIVGGGVGALATWMSEAHLACCTCVVLVARVLRADAKKDDWRAFAVDGLVCALVVLARLDQVLFAVAALAGLAIGRRSLRGALVAAVCAAALVAPYFAWNRAMFGRFTPISAAIHIGASINPHALGLWSRAGVGVLLGALVVTLALSRNAPGRRRTVGLLFGAAVLVHLGAVAALSRTVAHPWYWAQTTAFLAVFAPLALFRSKSRSPRGAPWAVLASAILLPGSLLWVRQRAGERMGSVLPLVTWIRANVAGGSRVFVDDTPNTIAFWTDLRVVAADGLTGDYVYQESLARLGAHDTLAGLGITYVVYADDSIGGAFEHRVREWSRPYGAVELDVRSTVFGTHSPLVLREADEVGYFDLDVGEIERAVIWRWPLDGPGSGGSNE